MEPTGTCEGDSFAYSLKFLQSVESLTKLAAALGVTVGDFFPPADPAAAAAAEDAADRRHLVKALDRLETVTARHSRELAAIFAELWKAGKLGRAGNQPIIVVY